MNHQVIYNFFYLTIIYMDLEYKEKYLKYKSKYISLKEKLSGEIL
jgi:hypothetical protein